MPWHFRIVKGLVVLFEPKERIQVPSEVSCVGAVRSEPISRTKGEASFTSPIHGDAKLLVGDRAIHDERYHVADEFVLGCGFWFEVGIRTSPIPLAIWIIRAPLP